MGGYGMKSGGEAGMYPESPITNTGAPTTPGANTPTIAPQTSPYGASPYTSPMYTLTPQSGYSGLPQQLQQAFALSPQAYAAPRTSLLSMYASPWGVIPGMNANQQTLGQMWGQSPAMGTAPPPGTPGYLQQNTNTQLPPPPPPQQPPPPPPPGSSAPSAPYTPPPSTTPNTPNVPAGRTPVGNKIIPGATGDPNAPVFRNQAKQAAYNAANKGYSNPQQPNGDYITPDPGANYGYAGTPGSLLGDFAAMGGNVGQYGGAMAMMAQKRNEMYRSPDGLTNEALFAAGRQGIDPRDMQANNFYDKQSGKWFGQNGVPYTNTRDYFRTTPVSGIYGKR